MRGGGRSAAGAATVALLTLAGGAVPAGRAQTCRRLVYRYQPVPYDAAHELPNGADPLTGVLEDGGPQVAVWLESAPATGVPPAQRGHHLFDLFVSARTGTFGIANRPGNGQFGSSPRFPYGHRDNVLPVWAWARGRSYPRFVMQDGEEDALSHSPLTSSLDPFYCRPIRPDELVDALTCPTPFFFSDKGTRDPGGRTVLYPPRHDLAASACQVRGDPSAPGNDSPDCRLLADLDDLATISGATPSPYVPTLPGVWIVPASLADGDYYLFLEVNKQYDQDAGRCPGGLDSECPSFAPHCDVPTGFCARHLAFTPTRFAEFGLKINLGLPSLVWAVRITIDSGATHTAIADGYLGYGDWDQPRGNFFPPDDSIPDVAGSGSGAARLLRTTDADGTWRLKVTSGPCNECQTPPLPPAPPPVADLAAVAPDGDRIHASFTQVGIGDAPVTGYEVRYRFAETMTEDDFLAANPGPAVGPGTPGTAAAFDLTEHEGIAALRTVTIGVRAVGYCQEVSPLATVTVTTPRQKFTTLQGCFVATAAFGSPLAAEVAVLRAFRDRLLTRSALGRALVRLYYASSPPLARLIAGDDRLRAAARALLAPAVVGARAALALLPGP